MTFEEVCYLLWHGRLPRRAELGDLQTALAAARVLPDAVVRAMRSLPRVDGMDALRTLTSILAHSDPEARDHTPQANYRKAVRLTGQLAALVAAWGRLSAGGGPIDPDPALGHAANFLYMLTGNRPSALAARAFDVSLILHADHELNASTFAARVVAATLSDIHSAVVAGVSALKGPLHGGANAEVMRMLLEIGRDAGPDRAEARRPREARAQGEDSWLRPPRVPHGGSARDAPATILEDARRDSPASRNGSRCRSGSRRSSRPRRS